MAQGRTRKQQQKRTRTPRKTVAAAVAAEPELVVVMRPQAAFRASAGRFRSAAGENVSDVGKLLAKHGATITPIFGPTEERVMARQAAHSAMAQAPMEDLSVFYKVEVPDERMDELRAQLAKQRARRSGLREAGRRVAEDQRHGGRAGRAASGDAGFERPADLSQRGAERHRCAVGVDAGRRTRTRHPHHRRRRRLALHARRSHAEPGRRRRRHADRGRRLAQPRHRRPRRVQRRRQYASASSASPPTRS